MTATADPATAFPQLMLDHCGEMLLLVDPADLRIVAANAVAMQTLGYAAEALLTRTITDIESDLQDIFYWEAVRAGSLEEIESQEALYLCADGSTLPVGKTIRIVDHRGERLLLIRARDISRERNASADLAQTLSQLRATLESTGNGILALDLNGRIANMNHLFSTLWAIPQPLLHAQDDAAILAFVASQVTDSARCGNRFLEIVNSEATSDTYELHDGRVVHCRSLPQYLGEHIIGRVFAFDDITDQKRAEVALRESRDSLEEKVRERTTDLRAANAALTAEKAQQAELIRKLADAHTQLLQSEKLASIGQLAAGVAHEINNPVGFVNSNLGTLQRYVGDLMRILAAYEACEPQLPATARAEMATLKATVDVDFLREDIPALLAESSDGLLRVKNIVQDLKNFSHKNGGAKDWANLEQGLDSTLNVVWNELKYKAEVVKEYGGIPEVRCILSQINQVFMNLLVNAAHAIDGRGRITLRTGSGNGEAWIEVEDTGKGIPPENLARIFEPFFTTKPVGAGTGLGLSVSYQIVEAHGGRFDVRSPPDAGACFRVSLPIDGATGTPANLADPGPHA